MLSIDGLSIRQGSFTLSVDRLEMPGKRNFLMGKNGSGKTTLLKGIAGITGARSGSISLNGSEIASLPSWKRKVSYIPQDLLLFPTLNVKDNIRISIRHGNGNEDSYRTVVEEMDLEGILKRRVWQISGGQAQRVAVARSLVSDPEMLLMDEPFSMQDERARAQMLSILYSLSDELNFSFLYVTHNTLDLEFGLDSLNFIESGRITESVRSVEEIRKYSSYSMIDYRNTFRIGRKYFRVSPGSIGFSDRSGYPYRMSEYGGKFILSVDSEGERFFITSNERPDGKYLVLSADSLIQLE